MGDCTAGVLHYSTVERLQRDGNAGHVTGSNYLRGMAMKIFLDDIRNPPDDSWTTCRSAEIAIALINELRVDEISFDHDLGTELTGHDVAKEFERLAFIGAISDIPFWSVHSANPVGAQRIIVAMLQAEKYATR